MSDKQQAVIQILHKEWALEQGYLTQFAQVVMQTKAVMFFQLYKQLSTEG